HVVTSLRGDLEGSQRLVEELAAIGEKYSSDYAAGCALRLAAYIKYQTRDIAGAVDQTEESAIIFARYGNMVMTGAARINKFLWEAEYAPSAPLAAKALEELNSLAALNPGQGIMELCQASAGILLKEAGEYDEAEKLLLKSYKVSNRKKARHSICAAAMLLANLYYLKKAQRLEDKFLMIFGKTAAEYGYVYFREMNYPTLISVCARCIEKNIHPEHMQKLVSKYFGADAAAYMAENPSQAAADPKAFISAFSAAPQVSKQIRVKLFGSFRMFVNEVEIGENEWKTRKISGILKYILAYPKKSVTRERLATIFWPESDTKAAYTSLRAALYELRKTLARFNLAFESDDALIIEGKDGFRLNSRHTIETDVNHFSELYKQYKAQRSASENIKELLVKLTQIYDGDFLESDPYDEWAALYSDHYRSMFVEVSHHLAGLYISDGESEAAENLLLRHMKVDPFDENACSMLIRLYDETGQKSRAASLRQQFCKRFEAEMGVMPELG
ncbi:MAG TPA: BTAD domain-containing putative transcriptional regulator, partial [Candidatus Nitrosocosmicus sp.]|nr:BTAD domain-containing putative transcriptional regulator [Candidatus Nitrosocosmicus sp.]